MSEQKLTHPKQETSLSELLQNRREKLKQLKQHTNAFPNDFRRQHLAGDLQKNHRGTDKQQLEQQDQIIQDLQDFKRKLKHWLNKYGHLNQAQVR